MAKEEKKPIPENTSEYQKEIEDKVNEVKFAISKDFEMEKIISKIVGDLVNSHDNDEEFAKKIGLGKDAKKIGNYIKEQIEKNKNNSDPKGKVNATLAIVKKLGNEPSMTSKLFGPSGRVVLKKHVENLTGEKLNPKKDTQWIK